MAFLDDLGKKITDVSQATLQKTKDMTETMRYTSMISDEEKNIRSYYTKLGEMFFTEVKDNPEGEYVSVVDQIKSAMAHIDECRSKIDEIKAAGKCANCGAPIAPDDTFCAVCGTKIERKTEAVNVCPNCGKPLGPDAAFCIYCGTKIETAEPSKETETAEPEDVQAEAVAEADSLTDEGAE